VAGERVNKIKLIKLFIAICMLVMVTACSEEQAAAPEQQATTTGQQVASPGQQATFPDQDIKIIIPFSPGGGFDSYIRALTPLLEKHLGNNVNILPINTPGAGGRRGALETFRAKPDGYTIGVFNMPGVLIPQLTEQDVGYDLEQITWLATLGNDPYAYVVSKNSELTTFTQLQTSTQPVIYGATGPSSTSYVATKIMNETLGIPYEIVTGYTGSSEYTMGVMRGDVTAALVSMSTARPYIKSGDVRVLATIGAKSADPAIADANSLGKPELEKLNLVRMIGGPPGMSADLKVTYEKAFMAAIADPEFKLWLEQTENDAQPAGADATSALVSELLAFYKNFMHILQE